jgi:chromosome segregation ATPase
MVPSSFSPLTLAAVDLSISVVFVVVAFILGFFVPRGTQRRAIADDLTAPPSTLAKPDADASKPDDASLKRKLDDEVRARKAAEAELERLKKTSSAASGASKPASKPPSKPADAKPAADPQLSEELQRRDKLLSDKKAANNKLKADLKQAQADLQRARQEKDQLSQKLSAKPRGDVSLQRELTEASKLATRLREENADLRQALDQAKLAPREPKEAKEVKAAPETHEAKAPPALKSASLSAEPNLTDAQASEQAARVLADLRAHIDTLESQNASLRADSSRLKEAADEAKRLRDLDLSTARAAELQVSKLSQQLKDTKKLYLQFRLQSRNNHRVFIITRAQLRITEEKLRAAQQGYEPPEHFEADLRGINDALTFLDIKNARLNKLQEEADRVPALERELSDLRAAAASLTPPDTQAALARLQADLDAARAEAASLAQQVAQADKAAAQLSTSHARALESQKALVSQETLDEQKAAAQKALDEQKAAAQKALEAQKAAAQKALDEQKAATHRALDEQKVATQKALDAQKALDEQKAATQKALDEQKAASQAALADAKTLHDEVASLRAQRDAAGTATQRAADLQAQLEAAQARADQLDQAAQQRAQDLTAQTSLVADLRAQLDAARAAHAAAEAAAQAATQAASAAPAEDDPARVASVKEANKFVTSALANVTQLEQRVESLKEANRTLRKEAATAQARASELEAQLAQPAAAEPDPAAVAALTAAQARVEDLESQLAAQSSLLMATSAAPSTPDLDAELSTLRDRTESLKESNRTLRKEASAAQERVTTLEAQLAAAQEKAAAAAAQSVPSPTTLSGRIGATQERIRTLEAQLTQLRDAAQFRSQQRAEIVEVCKTIADLERELTRQQVADVPIGPQVIVKPAYALPSAGVSEDEIATAIAATLGSGQALDTSSDDSLDAFWEDMLKT